MKGGFTGVLLGFIKTVVVIAAILCLTIGVSSTSKVMAVAGKAVGQGIGISVTFVKEMASGIKSTSPLDTGAADEPSTKAKSKG